MRMRELLDLSGKWPVVLFPLRRIDGESLIASDIIAVVQAVTLVVEFVDTSGLVHSGDIDFRACVNPASALGIGHRDRQTFGYAAAGRPCCNVCGA
jgi:hypothetical protein